MTSSRAYPDRPYLAASCAVWRAGQLLLAKRTAPPLVFSFPGGIVETGESLEAAALRELYEETEVQAEIIGMAGHNEIIGRDGAGAVCAHFVVLCFAAHWTSGEGTIGPEASDIVWTAPADAGRLPLTPGLQALIPAIVAMATR